MTHKLTRKEQGFTIIEVMIVLAIAALILLAVFLAIPNLQRSSRNTGRKADVGRIATAASNFVSNNNGTLPSSSADATAIVNDAGKLSQFPVFAAAGTITTAAANSLSIVPGAASVAALTVDGMQIVTGAKCSTSGVATSTGASARQMAIQYITENSGGVTGVCQDI